MLVSCAPEGAVAVSPGNCPKAGTLLQTDRRDLSSQADAGISQAVSGLNATFSRGRRVQRPAAAAPWTGSRFLTETREEADTMP